MVPAAHCFWGLGCSVPKITGPLVHMAFPVREKEAQWGVPKKQGCPFSEPFLQECFSMACSYTYMKTHFWKLRFGDEGVRSRSFSRTSVLFWGRVRPRAYSAGCIASGLNYGSSRRV